MINGKLEYQGFRDLKVYQLSYQLAMEIFEETKNFPKEERFSLTDQIRRSSRSIPANIAEAWKKRKYKNAFVFKMTDCSGEASETTVWLDMAFDCKYISKDRHQYFKKKYDEINKMFYGMIQHPEKFCH